MPDFCPDTVPQAVRRRLLLALRGWRVDRQAGGWTWHGLLHLSEEHLDAMSDRDFDTFLTAWSTTLVSAN